MTLSTDAPRPMAATRIVAVTDINEIAHAVKKDIDRYFRMIEASETLESGGNSFGALRIEITSSETLRNKLEVHRSELARIDTCGDPDIEATINLLWRGLDDAIHSLRRPPWLYRPRT